MKTKIISFAKTNAVVIIAAFAALVTSFIVPPDREYLGYFDWKTLTCLFCVLAVVCALRNIRFFYTMAKAIIRKFKNTKYCILALFALSILIVFRTIPFVVGLMVIPVALLFLDREALGSVDYGLLLTFVFFFIFSGNMARIDAVRSFFSALLDKNTLLFSALSCQVISNVPSAILLSQFTTNYRELLLGVNIGGVGTLIASLASLITFKAYTKDHPGNTLAYILKFTAFNVLFFGVLVGFCTLFG